MISKIATLAAAVMAVGLFSGSAMAGQNWPSSIVGVWGAQANTAHLTITILSQASTGKCRQIEGTILDTGSGADSTLLGFYCPSSGRFHFTRTDSVSKVTFQDYSGNVSDIGRPTFMGGVFAEVFTPANVGEYSFMASK
jgi:hypothetical protein